MHSPMRQIAFITMLLAGKTAFGSPPDACSLTSTVTDAKVSLSIPDGRTSFHEGEIIPLVLSFTSTADKRYRAMARNYDRSGRLSLDSYCLEPGARDPLADYFSTTFSMVGGLGGEQQLSEKPFTATAELNEWRQPGPGHYRLYVVSPRVSGEPGSLNSLRGGGAAVVLRSNSIEFDVIKTDSDTRAKQLQEATAAYENAPTEPCHDPHECAATQAARRLRFLNTKESTDTLARLFWGLNEQPGGWDLMFGLFSSSYQAEAIAAMQREIDSPDHAITQDFLKTLTKLQMLQVAGEVPREPAMDDAAALRKFYQSLQNIQAHEPELRKAALAATVAALPQKTGRAHALTLVTLATEKSDLLDKETAGQIHRQLLAEWGNLPEKMRADLIQTGWPPLDGTEALPILREIVSQPPPHFGNAGGFACYATTLDQCSLVTSRNKALKRIFELDPAEGRSLILRDLSDPEAQPALSLVKLLSSAQLRPYVQRAVQRIESSTQVRPAFPTSPYIATNDARAWDYSFAEEFADRSALKSLKAKFKKDNDNLPKGACLPYAEGMLRYFLRVDPNFGMREVQAQLAARRETHCYPTILEDLGKSLPTVEQFAIVDLDDSDLSVSTSAARALGRWGSAKAESALWARLTRFHEEWPNGVGELPLADKDARSRVLALENLERTLVQSIVTGTNWICGTEKLTQLRQIASREQRTQLSHLIDEWEGEDGPLIVEPYWNPDDQLTFGVLQLNYSGLDEEQIRTKLSQMPRGSKLYFQTYTAEQMGSPVSMEKQQAVLQGLRKYAAQYGVSIDERPR
jgi:hypothetical protein